MRALPEEKSTARPSRALVREVVIEVQESQPNFEIKNGIWVPSFQRPEREQAVVAEIDWFQERLRLLMLRDLFPIWTPYNNSFGFHDVPKDGA